MKKRLLSALLTFCMVLTFIPTAWAVNENSGDTTYGPDDDPICIEIGDKITLNGTEGATHSWTYHAGNGYLNDGMVLTSGEESKDTNQVSFQFTKAGTYSVTHTYREKAGDLLVWSDTFAITVENGSPTVADLEMYTDYTETEALCTAHPEVRGFFYQNDDYAQGGIAWLMQNGREIGRDVFVAGFNNDAAIRYAPYPVSSADHNWHRHAPLLVETALKHETCQMILPPTTHIREYVPGTCRIREIVLDDYGGNPSDEYEYETMEE